MSQPSRDGVLDLRAGEWIEVRSREEILATLDQNGRLENLPFMPEMLSYCGQRIRVGKRADKTCDPANTPWSIRRMTHAVHLEGVRCDGSGHGGCEAGCLIFWKEAWLKRVEDGVRHPESLPPEEPLAPQGRCSIDGILAASQSTDAEGQTVYSCQARDVRNFTSPMAAWDPRQYVRDFRSGNLFTGLAKDSSGGRLLEIVLALLRIFRAVVITAIARGAYPYVGGALATTPVEKLDLQPGELVQVRSREEIVATLNPAHRNRGLLFDPEMVPYCGGIYRVLRRVHHIIDERTGRMLDMKYPCIILEGVACQSDFHRLCPRAIYHYWRENWLKRVAEVPKP